jgi:hypothetical protein
MLYAAKFVEYSFPKPILIIALFEILIDRFLYDPENLVAPIL